MEEKWFNDACKIGVNFTSNGCEHVIYKGFKLSRCSEKVVIKDVRYRDLYSSLKDVDREMFKKYGFVKGADLIMIDRIKKRIILYNQLIKIFEGKILFSQEHIDDNFSFHSKRIKNAKDNIEYYQGLIQFYNIKIKD